MARLAGPKCRLCRREGAKLFLKGDRCESPKCTLIRKTQPPGMHGRARGRPSEYAAQLREKQKAKRIYGLLEAQFRRYFAEARKQAGATGETLLSLLERRLDNVVFRLGLASSRAQARQLVVGKFFAVNGRVTFSPSFRVRAGDVITLAKDKIARGDKPLPSWLVWDAKKVEGKILSLPKMEDIKETLETALIVEFYSR